MVSQSNNVTKASPDFSPSLGFCGASCGFDQLKRSWDAQWRRGRYSCAVVEPKSRLSEPAAPGLNWFGHGQAGDGPSRVLGASIASVWSCCRSCLSLRSRCLITDSRLMI